MQNFDWTNDKYDRFFMVILLVVLVSLTLLLPMAAGII